MARFVSFSLASLEPRVFQKRERSLSRSWPARKLTVGRICPSENLLLPGRFGMDCC